MGKAIVILRQADDSTEIVAAVEMRGYIPIIEPVLSIEYLDIEYPALDDDTPLIFTSAHGVQAFATKNDGRAHPVYTVGRNTADEAQRFGFENVESAFGTAEDLIDLLASAHKSEIKAPLFVRAEDISTDLKGILAKKDVKISEIVGYKAHKAENLSLNLLRAADAREIAGVMVFSARGARTFSELIEQYGRTARMKSIKALCISEAVLQSVSVLPFQEVVVAPTPDRYGMMKLLDQLP